MQTNTRHGVGRLYACRRIAVAGDLDRRRRLDHYVGRWFSQQERAFRLIFLVVVSNLELHRLTSSRVRWRWRRLFYVVVAGFPARQKFNANRSQIVPKCSIFSRSYCAQYDQILAL